jgi:hypothetical protein
MDNDYLYTKTDLAERWQVSEKSIDTWRKDGILTTCQGVPAVRFSPSYIYKLEGMELSRFSPIEKSKLVDEIKNLKRIIDEYETLRPLLLILSAKICNFE